ncbi:hypothetical protein V8F20_007596 [Naviculisporaceae sp. PSN 640]
MTTQDAGEYLFGELLMSAQAPIHSPSSHLPSPRKMGSRFERVRRVCLRFFRWRLTLRNEPSSLDKSSHVMETILRAENNTVRQRHSAVASFGIPWYRLRHLGMVMFLFLRCSLRLFVMPWNFHSLPLHSPFPLTGFTPSDCSVAQSTCQAFLSSFTMCRSSLGRPRFLRTVPGFSEFLAWPSHLISFYRFSSVWSLRHTDLLRSEA